MPFSSSYAYSLPPRVRHRVVGVVDSGARSICPRCRAILLPLAPVFRCGGCGQLISIENATAQLDILSMTDPSNPSRTLSSIQIPIDGYGGNTRAAGRGRQIGNAYGGIPTFEQRILAIISRLPPNHPQSLYFRAVLRSLSRLPDGTIDPIAIRTLSEQIERAGRVAPRAVVDLLPTRIYDGPLTDATSSTLSEGLAAGVTTAETGSKSLEDCAICMCSYERGDELRTLPCFHFFHKDCVDQWLLTCNKSCPQCRVPIDAHYDILTPGNINVQTGNNAATANA